MNRTCPTLREFSSEGDTPHYLISAQIDGTLQDMESKKGEKAKICVAKKGFLKEGGCPYHGSLGSLLGLIS